MEQPSSREHAVAASERRLYPEIAFGGFAQRDGTVAFYSRVNALLRPPMIALNYACGIGAHGTAEDPFTRELMRLRGKVAQVIGADVDPAGHDNPDVDSFLLIESQRLPLADAAVDLCLCDWGLEHFPRPRQAFLEIGRVLRPGGVLCLRTPNRWHYSSIGARLVPFSWHPRIRRILGQFHGDGDVFPVLYRCNTRRRLGRELSRSGFTSVVLAHRGVSHFQGASYPLALLGEWAERISPPLFCHELHAFARHGGGSGT